MKESVRQGLKPVRIVHNILRPCPFESDASASGRVDRRRRHKSHLSIKSKGTEDNVP